MWRIGEEPTLSLFFSRILISHNAVSDTKSDVHKKYKLHKRIYGPIRTCRQNYNCPWQNPRTKWSWKVLSLCCIRFVCGESRQIRSNLVSTRARISPDAKYFTPLKDFLTNVCQDKQNFVYLDDFVQVLPGKNFVGGLLRPKFVKSWQIIRTCSESVMTGNLSTEREYTKTWKCLKLHWEYEFQYEYDYPVSN